MKKRSMLRCISVLLCAVLCCPLFACAAAEDTDRTLFDNTDYILDVSEIVTSAMLLGGLPDRNELKTAAYNVSWILSTERVNNKEIENPLKRKTPKRKPEISL